ncbi:MAG: hypothetical protein ISS80_01100 [Candidatus Cloacimonetes bacterium]|nr:hypothetical protein [Candidatus Cloacimonadota bacterium]MBL7148646.1 hypothetical protein [Candidatus Cloacimonadota bacterium]
MGKLLIVAIFIVAAVITVILLSVQDRTEEIPELSSSNIAELQAKALCHEAIVYGMRNLNDGTVTLTAGENTQTYTNFAVMEGTIDSIQYNSNTTNDTIEIVSYAGYQNADETIQHKSSALVCWVPTYAQAAMSANGEIEVGGSADITGDIIENSDPPLSFEDLFGITKEEMEAIADNHFEDPPNNPAGFEDITWVSFANEGGSLKVTRTDWVGSGILIVDGDAQFSGGTFDGIMWITGTLFINGNDGFNGAIYVEGGIQYEDTLVLGNCQITYDLGAILDAFADASLTLDYELKIISWFEDE